MDLNEKDYIVVVQCSIVKQRCPGYLCERAFNERTGGFAEYPRDRKYRMIFMECGGCCGRGVHRKLSLLKRTIQKKEGIGLDRIVVQLASCVSKNNYHGPPCPHLDYIKTLVERIGFDLRQDTVVSAKSEQRRKDGIYD